MGKIYRREGSASWWAEWYDYAGVRHRESTRQSDRVAARQWLAQREREATAAGDSAHDVDAALVALSDTADWAPSTARANATRLGHLTRYLGRVRLAALTAQDVELYIDSRRQERASDHSIAKELSVLRQALRLARSRRWLSRDVVLPRHRARYVPRERWLTRDEYERVRRHVPEQWRTWLDVACWLGLRRSEVDRLDWADVDRSRAAWTVRVRGTKTAGARRTLVIPEPLRALLPAEPPASGPVTGDWHNVLRDLGEACDRAGVRRASPNDLRRTCATWLLEAGAQPHEVAQWLGHASLGMVMRVYGKVHPDSTARTAARLR